LVSICAVGDVSGDVESGCGWKFRFIDGCYIDVIFVEEQDKFCFLVVDGVCVPGYNA
jgi:hypothetical protein